MNKMEIALRELSEMDSLAAQQSILHRLHPGAKLITTVIFIMTTVSFHKYDLSGLLPMILWPVLLFQLSGIPMRTCFYKMRIVLPLVMAVGILNPFFDHRIVFTAGSISVWGGVVSMITLMLKGVLCLMASFLLAASTSMDALCGVLRKWHVPGMLVTLLLLTYRYVGVLTEEASIMTDAYHLRAPGQKGIHISAWGSFLGQLLLRSMDRAQQLYASMLLRGYHEHFHYAEIQQFRVKDAIYIIACVGVCLVMRFIPVVWVLGRIVT